MRRLVPKFLQTPAGAMTAFIVAVILTASCAHLIDDGGAGGVPVKDIAAVADGLGLQRFVLVGHSLGGAASIAYVAEHPKRVAGLVLVGAPGKTPPAQAQQIMGALQSDYEKVALEYWNKLLAGARPQVDRQLRGEMTSMPRDAGLSLIRAIFEFDPVPALNAYRGPKLALVTPHGDTPGDLHKLVADLPYKLIIDTSHWPHMDKPAEFNRMLSDFLASAA